MVLERTAIIGVGAALGAEVWGWFPDEELEAALYLGANVVPINADDKAVAALASRARLTPRRCSSIVGPARSVLDFYEAVRPAWGDSRDVRPHQPMLAMNGQPRVAPDPRLRAAVMDDIDVLFPACVAMFTEELGISPLVPDGGAAYRRRVATLIQQGRALVVIEDDQVLFKAEVGVVAQDVAQIQGVWVDPEHRGRHVSEPCMAAVVELTRLRHAPVVSLYVNDFNQPALASYRKVGFEQVGEFATVLF
ncbi:MAG: GNAT family N-acetyltransferase [Actinobacteria bacterium]|nr:GNAT family N-acetyltransferase [Actinomycetota bacterium]MCB9415179.1 GNAT family N-acetyltransferase [Actinomycetota bacterium]